MKTEEELQTKILETFPYARIVPSSLKRDDPYFSIYVSMNPQSTWINKIYFNSDYMVLSWDKNKLECVSKHFTLKKFRKCTAKTIEDVVNKLNIWKISHG
jgi:hypothetical protein